MRKMVKKCWNCGRELDRTDGWCDRCGRLQSDDTPVSLTVEDKVSVILHGDDLALEVHGRCYLPASPKGILVKLKKT